MRPKQYISFLSIVIARISLIVFASLVIPPHTFAAERHIGISKESMSAWKDTIEGFPDKFKAAFQTPASSHYDLIKLRGQRQENASGPSTGTNTIERLADFEVINARSLRKISSVPLRNVRLFSFTNSRFIPVPFDIIEYTDSGSLILSEGPEKNSRESDGVFSGNDKLFFMAADSGDMAKSEDLELLNASDIQEISLASQDGREKGWVYIAAYSKNPPEKSRLKYTYLEPDEFITYSPYYITNKVPPNAMKRIRPEANQTNWAESPLIGGSGEVLNGFIDMFIRIVFAFPFTMKWNENDFDLTWRAWYSGNVVSIIRVSWKISTPFGIGAPTMMTDVICSPFSITNINFVYTPFDPSILLKKSITTSGETLRKATSPGSSDVIVYDRQDKRNEVLNLKGTQQKNFELKKSDKSLWFIARNPAGTFMVRSMCDSYVMNSGSLSLTLSSQPGQTLSYYYTAELKSFSTRQAGMYQEWTVIPSFNRSANPDNEDIRLVQKFRDNPLFIMLDGSRRFANEPIIHIPDIKREKSKYKY